MLSQLYRYKGCGLENVYLVNGYSVRKLGSGEEAVAIEDIEGLHKAIALHVVESSAPLTAKTYKFLRKELGMSQRQVAQIQGVEEQTVSLWERAQQPVPQSADVILRALTKEKLSGHPELAKLIERFNALDRQARELEAIEFQKEQNDGWTTKCA